MRNLAKYLLVAVCAVAFVATADAQGRGGQGGGGRGQGGQGGQGRGGQGGGMMFGGGGAGLTGLVVNKSVSDELKITDDQKTKLADWAKEAGAKQREKMQEMFQGGERPDPAKMQEMMAATAKEQMEAVSKILTADQVKRLKELQLQIQGFQALTSKDTQAALKMTDEQKDAIKEIGDAMRKEMMELFPRPMGGERPTAEQMAENAKKRTELTKKYFDKAKGQLTDEQKTLWAGMTGKPFEFKADPPRRRDN
ncbi:MAG: hypothetical protein U0798_13990 [Gemmataceae bacterium]